MADTEKNLDERSLAFDMLQELKKQNKYLWRALVGLLAAVAITVVGFLFYISQWDYSTTYTYEAAGVYALIDSQGNVISQDISEEDWANYLEWWRIYGEVKGDGN